jgi:hypothetical protein
MRCTNSVYYPYHEKEVHVSESNGLHTEKWNSYIIMTPYGVVLAGMTGNSKVHLSQKNNYKTFWCYENFIVDVSKA